MDFRGACKCFKVFPVGFCKLGMLQKIGASVQCALKRLSSPPFLDFCVMSGKQDFGNIPTLPFRRAGILRIFEKT